MTDDDFFEPFNELTQAFSVQKPNDKAKIYFIKLKRLSSETFKKTCDYAIENLEKFPSIKQLLAIAPMFPDRSDLSQFDCKDCGGCGLVVKWSHSFRCRCLNGERMSKKIALVPFSQDEKKFWYGVLNKQNNQLYGKD